MLARKHHPPQERKLLRLVCNAGAEILLEEIEGLPFGGMDFPDGSQPVTESGYLIWHAKVRIRLQDGGIKTIQEL